MSEIDFEQGPFGTKAIIKVEWHDSLLELLLSRDIRELELNTGKGWRGKSLEFLKRLPQLQSLNILDQALDLIEPIHFLHDLVELGLSTYSDTPVNFSAFPKIEKCGFEWIKGSDSLFDCVGLKSLAINNYKKESSGPFSKLKQLENLAILNSGIGELNGVFGLTKLTALRLTRLRKIDSLCGIEGLTNLEELEIQTCKGISSVSPAFSLGKLKKLFFLNIGNIDTFRGIEKLTELEQLVFDETTNIIDGDLSPILSLRKLKKVAFQNRRHYTHRREDFGRLYFES